MKKIVSSNFRKYILERYPILCENISYRRFFQYLLFSSYCDDNNLLLIPTKIIARMEYAKINHHYNPIDFLESFKKDVLLNFEWSNKEIISDFYGLIFKPRVVINNGFDDELNKKIQEELLNVKKKGFVYFLSGEEYTERRKREVKEKETLEIINKIKEQNHMYNKTQQKIINYFDSFNADKAITTKLYDNWDKATGLILEINNENSKLNQLRLLQSIKENPSIIYGPSVNSRTCRLFHKNDCVIGLKSEIRKAICSGWTEVDLKSSQFVILSEILDAPLAKSLLLSEVDLWKYLNNVIADKYETPSKELKGVLKSIIYGICFGEGKRKLKKICQENNINSILDCELIKELLDRRTAWFHKIKEEGYVLDVWGNKHSLEDKTIENPNGRWEGAVAASKIQSIEMEIISALFDYAKDNDKRMRFKIMLFQHDGCTIAFQDKQKKELALKEMKQVVVDKATRFGYSKMKLEHKDL